MRRGKTQLIIIKILSRFSKDKTPVPVDSSLIDRSLLHSSSTYMHNACIKRWDERDKRRSAVFLYQRAAPLYPYPLGSRVYTPRPGASVPTTFNWHVVCSLTPLSHNYNYHSLSLFLSTLLLYPHWWWWLFERISLNLILFSLSLLLVLSLLNLYLRSAHQRDEDERVWIQGNIRSFILLIKDRFPIYKCLLFSVLFRSSLSFCACLPCEHS